MFIFFYIFLNCWKKLIPNYLTIFFVYLQSFVDGKCSGRQQCEVQVPFLVFKFTPCPRELSSYLESSYVCLPGMALSMQKCEFAKHLVRDRVVLFYSMLLIILTWEAFLSSLYSYADARCSGKQECKMEVLLLPRNFNPCPR